jgi:segregation and condensation protein B
LKQQLLDAMMQVAADQSEEQIKQQFPALALDDIQRIQQIMQQMKSKVLQQSQTQAIKEKQQEDEPEDKRVVETAVVSAAEKSDDDLPEQADATIKNIVEAILFAANRTMTARQIQAVFPELEQPEIKAIKAALRDIEADYQARPIGLKQLASGFRFQVKAGFSPWISRLFEEKPPRYSRALLETLSIIAYRQPVTRGEIEEIRGVSVSSNIIRTLLDREWVRVIAYKEVPGRPALYGTTKQFLDYFNLSSLEQLPTLEQIQEMDLMPDADGINGEQENREQENTPVKQEQTAATPAESTKAGQSESPDNEKIPTTLH